VASISEDVVRELAGFTGTDAPVTSLYLDVDGRRFVRPQDLAPHLDSLLREGRTRASTNGLSRAAQHSVEADLARMAEHVRGSLRRSHLRGVAMFSCSAHGLWRVVELGVPVRNRVVVNHTPYVRELEAALAQRLRYAALLADRQRARLLVFEHETLVDKTELIDRLPRHDDDKGDLNRDQVAGQTAAAASRHLRRAARVAFQVFREQGFDHIVVGAPEEVASALERELHPYLRERIAARLSIAVGASEEEICAAILSAEGDVERARETALVIRLRDAVGAGRGGVAGLEAALAALVARRVDTLLVSDGYEAPGWRCRACSFVGARGPGCPVCATTMDRVDDVVEEAVEDALAQSCRVIVCHGNADLDVAGRIGALLRY
jgi:peptide subunit release factor 1 (eRF1)